MSEIGARLALAWSDGRAGDAATVYLGSRYQRLFAAHDGSDARVLRLARGGAVSSLPLLVRELGGGVREAYSAYGYGGLVGNLELGSEDVCALRAFLAAEGIVALFVRHAPFLANERLWPTAAVELNRRTYAAELPTSGSFEDHLATLPQKLRWSVRFATRSGLAVRFHALDACPPSRLEAFHRLYVRLMTDKGTGAYYRFPLSFIHEHGAALGAACELAEIPDPVTGEPIAAALFLLDTAAWAHYHLSAASADGMKRQAMELLLASAMHRYGARGLRRMHLGGGHALDESDGLSRFKRKFAGERMDFCCTRLVCDDVAYTSERVRLALAHPGFFLIGDARGSAGKPALGAVSTGAGA